MFYKLVRMAWTLKPILISMCFLMGAQAFAQPSQIVIIRHGEKTDPSNELNTEGCERAFSLMHFFLKNPLVEQYGSPVAIYAMRPNSIDGSVRPIQTIAPTANQLKLPIQDKYTKLDYAPIVQEILNSPAYQDKTVLIAWEHDAIPGLAQAFGVTLDASQTSWAGKVFDEAWVINPADHFSLQIIPENALSTDNPLGGQNWQDGPTSKNPPVVAVNLANHCENNDALNALVAKWITPAL
jgi:hypothetical protein